jgi:probable blue pigment (indigoidine) exporter
VEPTPPDGRDQRRNILLLVVLGLVWGSAYPVIRYGIVSGATPITFAAARYALTVVSIAAVAAVSRIPRPNARAMLLSAVIGLPIVGVYGLLLYVGEQTTSGSLSAILIAVAPFLTTLFALSLLPGESVTRIGVIGLAAGFIGVIVLVAPPPGVQLATTIWGPVAVVGAAASFALGSVLLRKWRPEGETLWGVAVQFAVATAFLTATVPVLEPHPSLPLTGPVLLSLAYLLVVPSTIGYVLYFYLHHRIGPGQTNVVAYINPIAALSIGVLLFAEPFEWWELAGFALILLGLTLLTRYGRPRRPPP